MFFITTYQKFFWIFPEGRSFLERCVSASSEHQLHRGAISWRRWASLIIVLCVSVPCARSFISRHDHFSASTFATLPPHLCSSSSSALLSKTVPISLHSASSLFPLNAKNPLVNNNIFLSNYTRLFGKST